MAKPKKSDPPGVPLGGKTSNRIRNGEIPREALSASRPQADDRPKASSILRAIGRGLGAGATRRRSGPGAADDTSGRGAKK